MEELDLGDDHADFLAYRTGDETGASARDDAEGRAASWNGRRVDRDAARRRAEQHPDPRYRQLWWRGFEDGREGRGPAC